LLPADRSASRACRNRTASSGKTLPRFAQYLESQLSAALGRPVKVENLKLAIFSGGVAAEGFSIADDLLFSHAPFVRAKSIKVSVSLMPLIFSHSLNLEGITIDEPQIFLIQTNTGTWNYSSLGNKPAAAPASAAPVSTDSSRRRDAYRLHPDFAALASPSLQIRSIRSCLKMWISR